MFDAELYAKLAEGFDGAPSEDSVREAIQAAGGFDLPVRTGSIVHGGKRFVHRSIPVANAPDGPPVEAVYLGAEAA